MNDSEGTPLTTGSIYNRASYIDLSLVDTGNRRNPVSHVHVYTVYIHKGHFPCIQEVIFTHHYGVERLIGVAVLSGIKLLVETRRERRGKE